MSGARKILVVGVLVLPLLSWVASNGGLPVCCWGALACPASPARTAAACPMPSMQGVHRGCAMAPVGHLILPSPAMPLFPTAPAAIGAPAAMASSPIAPAPARSLPAGWSASIFHPPHLLAS